VSLGFDLVRCGACGHRYSTELLSAETLAGSYYNEPDADLRARSLAAKESRFAEYRAMLDAAGLARGRVLDVGCNAGELLGLFRRAGYAVAGLERSPGPARHARETLGAPIWEGDAEGGLPDDETFDLITMTHVLEHLTDPGRVLDRLRRALRPGGALLLEVPNADDRLGDVFGGYYRPLCPGDHVSFFDEDSLARLLEGHGFAPAAWASPSHARDLVYASLLSAVDWARRRPAASGPASSGVEAQTRYRGRLRAPLRRAIDRLVEAADPAVVALTSAPTSPPRGPVLIVLARPA
jgi:SAM-dependent methyltransferase